MPIYFFDVQDESGWHRDLHGVELDSFAEAREQAIALLPDIARDEMPDGDRHDILCEVRDGSDRVLYRGALSFRGERLGEADAREAGCPGSGAP